MHDELGTNETPALSHAISGAEARDSAQVGELPMVVWLKGHEPHCEQFVLDADAAMEQLGIKRSRLTQISGRELRVGRIRVGRYLKPMYREQDIEAYKKWTRATASHVRSSSVLREAADQLAEKQEVLYDRIEETLDKLSEDIGHNLGMITDETYRIQRDQFAELTTRIEAILGASEQDNSHIDAAIERLQGAFVETMETIKSLQVEISDDVTGRVEQLRAEQCSSLGLLGEARDQGAKILQRVEAIQLASTESYELIFDGIAQLKTNFDSVGRFNARLADALQKVIECQRESMLAAQSHNMQILRALEAKQVVTAGHGPSTQSANTRPPLGVQRNRHLRRRRK